MAIRKTGSRQIIVDGMAYRWRIRRKPTYCQACFAGCLTVAIQLAENPGRTLLALGAARPDNLIGNPSVIVTPQTVAATIRAALAEGWEPATQGPQFVIHLAPPTAG
jgi:hypothetical protein